MSDIDAFRERARGWLQSVAAQFGRAAQEGLSTEERLALGRRYLAARSDAGFAGINWPTQ